jgi:hypothetical protein
LGEGASIDEIKKSENVLRVRFQKVRPEEEKPEEEE